MRGCEYSDGVPQLQICFVLNGMKAIGRVVKRLQRQTADNVNALHSATTWLMIIVSARMHSDLFIIFTCSLAWKDIQKLVLLGQSLMNNMN